ncbi:MAG: VWA domain-containing protein [Thermomicrobiales bacterium]
MPSPATKGRKSSPTAPVNRIVGFGRLLRANGVPVSQAEIADALRAIETMPEAIRTRAGLAATLAATLVKRSSDLPAFRKLFAFWFEIERPLNDSHSHVQQQVGTAELAGVDLLPRPGAAIDAGQARHEHGTRVNLRQFFGEGVSRPEHDHHAGDRLRLTWLGSELEYDQSAGAPPLEAGFAGSFGLRRVATSGRPGALRPPSTVEIPRSVVMNGLRELFDASNPDEQFLAWLEKHASGIRREQRAMTSDLWPVIDEDAAQSALPDLRWDALSIEDLTRLERTVHRLGKQLGGAPGSRKVSRRGRLDARRTFRRAAATGGVPFTPVFRARREDRPRLIVLCDVSLSVRGAARWLLAVSQAAQRQTGRVRTFVFVRQLRDVTLTLAQSNFDDAISNIFGGKLIDTSEASDGGHALGELLKHQVELLTAKTTLLILGDARNNGNDPNLPALAELRHRCRHVIWLTPEQRGTWSLAGCDLPRYATHCDLVATVRTPHDLERVVATISTGIC